LVDKPYFGAYNLASSRGNPFGMRDLRIPWERA
jgi:hypothetical protein